MRVLVIGSGGREHALAWKIAQSSLVEQIYCAPGNAGIAQIAECVALKADDVDGLTAWAREQRIDLTVVGPEVPLIAGIVDRFAAQGLAIVGPSQACARLEGSKVFAKTLMQQAGIPTAPFGICDSHEQAQAYLDAFYHRHASDTPIVIKADGLAAGKGVVVAQDANEARDAAARMMSARVFGDAGSRIVIEECLVGQEASIMALTDGETIVPLAPSQDHKRAYDGDQGPNTGGMGAYSPVPILPPDVAQEAVERILRPAVHAIGRQAGVLYRGILYAGIMVTPNDGLQTIEFNCRLGDPETQAILPLLQSDLVPLLVGVAQGRLGAAQAECPAQWRQAASVCVVAASPGYPGAYPTGLPITGLDRAAQNEAGPTAAARHEAGRSIAARSEAGASPSCLVFHAGTRQQNGQFVTDGGRVMSVTGLGPDIPTARQRAYDGLARLHFDGIHYRRDIANRSL